MQAMYYVRWRGQILGPIPAQRLTAMVQRGEVSGMHEVSTDGVVWVRVHEVPGLVTVTVQASPTPEPTSTQGVSSATPLAGAASAAQSSASVQWFYNDGSGNIGPMSKDQILMLYQQGRISQRAHVWQPGWPAWRPISSEFSTARPVAATTQPENRPRNKSEPSPSTATLHDLTARELLIVKQELELRGKSALVTYLLWLFLGLFVSAHRFYHGKIQSAVLYIAAGWIPRVLSASISATLENAPWEVVATFEDLEGIYLVNVILNLVCLGVSLWWFIDVFFIPQMLRQSNRQLEQQIISEVLAARR